MPAYGGLLKGGGGGPISPPRLLLSAARASRKCFRLSRRVLSSWRVCREGRTIRRRRRAANSSPTSAWLLANFEGGFLQLVRNERGIVFVHVENVVDPYREGIDVGDDFLKLVGQAAFGEVVEFKRRVGVARAYSRRRQGGCGRRWCRLLLLVIRRDGCGR